jgi:hypothetical protein
MHLRAPWRRCDRRAQPSRVTSMQPSNSWSWMWTDACAQDRTGGAVASSILPPGLGHGMAAADRRIRDGRGAVDHGRAPGRAAVGYRRRHRARCRDHHGGCARWPRWRAGPPSIVWGASGAHSGQGSRRYARLRSRSAGKIRHAYSRAGGRRAEGRAERWRRHVHGAGIAADGPHRSQRHRHDRGNLAARLLPADRREEGKVLAAVRAGIATVLLPARNRKDLEDVPEAARK